jgi:ribosomal protein S18 acetylase RimI-like enzyme
MSQFGPDLEAMHESLLTRVNLNVAERTRVLARLTPGAVIEEAHGLLLVAESQAPLNVLKMDRVLAPPADPAALIARARSFFARLQVAWSLEAPEPFAAALAPAATDAGLATRESERGMLLTPPILETETPPDVRIDLVRDSDTLRLFSAVSAAGFGYDTEVMEALHPPALLDVPDITCYLARVNDEPAATALRFTSHGIAQLTRVSTLPAFRNRGLGEAVTRRATADGAHEGCLAAFLFATDLGYRVYERIGYHPFVTYHVWRAAAAPDDARLLTRLPLVANEG